MTGRRPAPKPDSGRLPGLDVLRFFAIVLVIFHHLKLSHPGSFSYKALSMVTLGGWTGVELFFVLSGFLVSGLLFTEYKARGRVDLLRFLLRRGARIYPPFWVMILASILLYDFHVWDGFYLHGFLGEMLFLQNYLGGLWGTTWSLAVEEHFYLFLALMFFLLLKFTRQASVVFRLVPWIYAATAAGCLALRYAHAARHQDVESLVATVHQSQFRIDSLMFGVLIAYWWHLRATETQRTWVAQHGKILVLAGALFLIPAFIWDSHLTPWIPVWGVMLFCLGGGMMVLGAAGDPFLGARPWLWLANLGRHSYSVYLWHGMVYELLMQKIRDAAGASWNNLEEFTALFVLSWGIGIIAAKLFEYPFLKLRQRYLP
jgi:peptidoglycan/LPS O-acetylase OafA/YrhL